MAKNNKSSVAEILQNFLSEKLKKNPDLQNFLEKPLPEYITKNLAEDKTLRPYQEIAVKTFIFFFENNELEQCRQLLFNMATGTGKTLVMACCILYLYTK